MNERIEKLMDETDSWCDKNFPSDWLNRVDEFLPLWNEKFAELIAMECMSICEELGDKGLDGHYCADEIKKQFGV